MQDANINVIYNFTHTSYKCFLYTYITNNNSKPITYSYPGDIKISNKKLICILFVKAGVPCHHPFEAVEYVLLPLYNMEIYTKLFGIIF